MSTTGVVITGCVLTIVIYDLIVVLRKGVGCSVSRSIQRVAFCSPLVVFGLGCLFGHLFMYLPVGQSVVAVPEKTNEVSVIRIPELEMNAIFVPDGINVKLKEEKTGKAVACPSPKN